MSRLVTVCLIVLVCVAALVSSQNGIIQDGQGKRVLALLDNYGIRETHSIFFKSLRDRGFQITYKPADDPDLALSKYGEYLFDHLILFSPNVVEFGGNITSKSVIDFIDDGGNVLVAASSEITEPLKEIAAECGVEFSDEGTYVIDRFNTDVNDDGRNTLVISETDNLINNELLVGKLRSSGGAPFLYKGVGMSIDSENPLLLEVLTASATAYAYKPDEPVVEYPHSIGKSTLLITGLQARNNARVVFVGSLDFFSNDFFEAPVQKSGGKRFEKSGNEALSVSLTQWTFKEKGVLRVVSVNHHLVGEKTSPAAYTIKENLIYSIKIEEVVNGKWQPFQNTDVQLEFIRLDPFVRQTLKPSSSGVFTAQFQVPDVYGIYKFNVEYNRIGYTNLFSSTQVSVRPFQHIEYERFIPAAFPYYASAFSMMLAVFFFSFIQLYHHDSEPKTTTTSDKSGIQSPQK